MRIFLIVALLFLSTPAYAQEQEPECGALQVMIKKLMAEENLAYLSDAIDLSGTVHMWYVSAKPGDGYSSQLRMF